MQEWDLPSISVNFPCHRRPSVNFSVHLQDFPTTSVNFTCGHRNFGQLSVQPQDLLSTSANFLCNRATCRKHSVLMRVLLSTFRASVVPSMNIQYVRGLSVNFRAALRNSVNSCQFSMHPQDLPSTSVNFPCVRKTFHQLSVVRSTFRQIPSTFCTSTGPFINFRLLSVCTRNHLSTLCGAMGHSVNSPWSHGTFRLLLSTFCCFCRTICKLPSTYVCPQIFHQHFVWPQDLL